MFKSLIYWSAFVAPSVLASGHVEKINLSIDCGNFTNRDQFASYGYEQQLYTCREIVFSTEFALNVDKLKFFVEWAPLYESIQYKAGIGEAEYRVDPETNESLDAQTLYLDWYNNLGDRTYFLGDYPLIEAKLIYGDFHQWHIGRQKLMAGSPEPRFWRDNSAIGPYADWISRDLFSGLSYRGGLPSSSLRIELGGFSGDGNPLKGYANYGAGVLGDESPGDPNISSNNTPTWNARISSDLFNQFGLTGSAYWSYQNTVSGSTWWRTIDPSGKHNRVVTTYGAQLAVGSALKVYGQYTEFLSGLSEWSLQNDGHDRFKDITQKGYFVASEWDLGKLSLGVGFEQFDRYDFNIYHRDNYVVDPEKIDLVQTSTFGKIAYRFSPELALELAAHQLENPLPNYSEVYTTNPETAEGLRYSLSLTYRSH